MTICHRWEMQNCPTLEFIHQVLQWNEILLYSSGTLHVAVVAILFAISWLPLGVFTVVSEIVELPASSQSLYLTLASCHLVAMSSAVSNPVMYGWMNSNIRQELVQLLPAECAPLGRRHVVEECTTVRTAVHTNTTHCRKESVTLLVHNGDNAPASQHRHVLTEL